MARSSGRLILLAFAAVLIFLSMCAGLAWPVEIVFYGLVGWMPFLNRVLEQVTVDWLTVLVSLGALGVFTIGLHRLLRWLHASLHERSSHTDEGHQSDQADTVSATHWQWRWSLTIVAVLMLMFIAGTSVVGITHQVAWLATSPEPMLTHSSMHAAYRSMSRNSLRQLGIGLLNYEEVEKSLPPGALMGNNGHLEHGWQALLLPYIEEGVLHDQIDFGRPWHDPRNAAVYKTPVNAYKNGWLARQRQPVTDAEGYPLSDYAANVHVIGGTRTTKLEDITDGVANTIMAGEIATNRRAWGYPANWRDPLDGVNTSPNGFGSPWLGGGAQFVMAGGSVRRIDDTIDPEVLKALSTPNGGETSSRDNRD